MVPKLDTRMCGSLSFLACDMLAALDAGTRCRLKKVGEYTLLGRSLRCVLDFASCTSLQSARWRR